MLHTRNNPGFFTGTLSSKPLPMSWAWKESIARCDRLDEFAGGRTHLHF
jgi:hypothetical protein